MPVVMYVSGRGYVPLRVEVGHLRPDSARSRWGGVRARNGAAAWEAGQPPRLPGRFWELWHNFTAHDVAYIALVEATNSVFYTCYEKLCRGHR